MARQYSHLDDVPHSVRQALANASPAFSVITDSTTPETLTQSQHDSHVQVRQTGSDESERLLQPVGTPQRRTSFFFEAAHRRGGDKNISWLGKLGRWLLGTGVAPTPWLAEAEVTRSSRS